jgi:hypothetical protein
MRALKIIVAAIVIAWAAFLTWEIYWTRVEARAACSYSWRALHPEYPKDVVWECR